MYMYLYIHLKKIVESTLTEDWLRVFVEVVVEFQFPIQLFRDQHVLKPTIKCSTQGIIYWFRFNAHVCISA